MSLEELANLQVITVSKVPERLQQTPSAIYVLTQEEIRRSGTTSIPEALRLVPGVEVARIDSNKWAVGVRGFVSKLSRLLLVLIDGRSVYTTLFAGVYWDVQDMLLEDIDRIEVIRGPGGTIWGPNAVNGVVNIITRSASETQGLYASAGGGNVDSFIGELRFGSGVGQDVDYRVYARGLVRDPEFHDDGQEFDDWEMAKAGFRVDRALDDRQMTLQGEIYGGAAGDRVAVSAYSPPSITTVLDDSDLSGGHVLAEWHRSLNSDSDIQLLTYYDRTVRSEANFKESRNTFDVDFVHRLERFSGHQVLWGLGARFSAGDATVIVPTLTWVPEDATDKIYSAFIQDEIALIENRLALTVGSKFFHNNYTGFEIQPTARVMFTPSPQQSLWGAVTGAARTPSRVEEHLRLSSLVDPSVPIFLRLTGDEGFASERLVGYEAGYRFLPRADLFVDVAGFYNDYDDVQSVELQELFLESSPPPDRLVLPLVYHNRVRGTTTGFEIAPAWSPKSWLRLRGSYSYLHLDFENNAVSTDPFTVPSLEGSSPSHQIVVRSFLELRRDVELDMTYRYVSSLTFPMIDSYHAADMRVSWGVTPSVELSLIGRNLLEPEHPEFESDAGPNVGIRRGVFASVTFTR
jgi:iron complex outermembrane receptor protein